MKKFLLFMLGVLIALPGFARIFGYDYEGQTLWFEVLDEDAKTCQTAPGSYGITNGQLWFDIYNTCSGDVVIPAIAKDGETETEYTVVGIGEWSFLCAEDLGSVTIPNTVTHIGARAFASFREIKGMDKIPNGITSVKFLDSDPSSLHEVKVDSFAFEDCERLTSVTFSNNYFNFGWRVFAECALTEVTLPDNVTDFGSFLFEGCYRLATVKNFPQYCPFIPEGMFSGTGFTSLDLPDWIESIEFSAFSGCRELTSWEIPGSVTYIKESAFAGCSGLKSLEIPGSVTYIGQSAFDGCSGLTSLEIPASVTDIREFTFARCSSLSWLIIPETVTTIRSRAFLGCENLFSVMFLPKNCDVASDAFKDCKFLNKVAAYDSSLFESGAAFYNTKSKWTIEDDETLDVEKGIIWSADNSECWVSGKYSGVLRIPEGMTNLYWSDFADCPKITELYLPNTLEGIGPQAFWGMTIKEIVIPNRVSQIQSNTFDNVSPVKVASPDVLTLPFDESVTVIKYDAYNGKVTDNFVYSRQNDVLYYAPLSVSPKFEVPETVTEITDKAFALCDGLTEIVLPERLSKLGEKVWEGCTNIKSVVCQNPNAVEASRDLFPVTIYDTATLYVPKGSKSKYMSTVPWKYFSNISEEYTGIDDVVNEEEGSIDFSAPVQVYNLQGVMVGRSLDNLAPGIYIVRQGNIVKKIAVK